VSELPVLAASRGPWSRRWFRRLTYLIASGAVLTALTAWAVQRPEVDRWIIGRLDLLLRRETGLGLRAESLEVHPFEGRILVHHLAVGDDLLQADLLEIKVEWATLLHTPHLRGILLQNPTLLLDPERLARIRLRQRPPSKTTPKARLDRLEITGGRAHLADLWGIRKADFSFQATGRGWNANQLWLDLTVPRISLDRGKEAYQGDLALGADLTERRVDLQQGQLRLGDNHVDFKGSYRFTPAPGKLSLAVQGGLDLVQAQRLANPGAAPAGTGSAKFQAELDGPLDHLEWTAKVQGKGLQAKDLPLHPGSLEVEARGAPAAVKLERLAWASQDGRLEATGDWNPRSGVRVDFSADAIPMAPLAGSTRTGFLHDLLASFKGVARLAPGRGKAASAMPGLDQLSFQGTGQFTRDGQRMGGLSASLDQRRIQAAELDLTLPELALHGRASGTLGQSGTPVEGVEGEADLATDAGNVAAVLAAWDIGSRDDAGRRVPLDMSGRTQVQAQVSWSPRSGLQLTGQAAIQDPRWHGARADQLRASVSIDRDVLRVSDIVLDKGQGGGWGDLWLTWAALAPGRDQIDMCYRASRLPVREGLKAADLGDLALDGTGSGWVRLHGPFGRMVIEGQGVAEQAEVYGLRIPAASADFYMDIAGERLRTTDVRIADSLDHLAPWNGAPSGALALQGSMDMDLQSDTWQVALDGKLDTGILGLPGPRFQARVETRLDGPYTAPLGSIVVPTGTLAFTQGRLTQGDETLEGLAGAASFRDGRLEASAGLEGRPRQLLSLKAEQLGADRIAGSLEADLDPGTADTASLASHFTGDFLKDVRLGFRAQGAWTPQGLHWQGQTESCTGTFEGFRLSQTRPGQFSGDEHGLELAMGLEGTAALDSDAGQGAPLPTVTSMELHGRIPFAGGGPLALTLAGTSDLTSLKTILDRVVQPAPYSLLADLRAAGKAVFDLNLGGTLDATALDGTLTLQSGRMVAHSYPLSVDDLAFTAQFKGRDIIIPRTAPMRGILAQGALTAWGQMTWRPGAITAYDLHTNLEDFQLRDLPEGFEMLGSLDANLKGSDLDGGRLSGAIWAKRTLYRADINLSDLILANALGPSLNTPDPSDPLARIDLDLELHLAEPWELDTNLLKMRGRPTGPFWIRGNLTQPGLKGKMDLLPGGRLTNLFPAGDIVLERGSVDFTDPSVFNPNLDVTGQIDISPYLVTLNVSGTLDALQARPYSTPSLRQDEIFAILIDPGAVYTVGGAPGASTQTALSSGLAGTGTGLLTSLALADFQEQLRKTLNLDRVNVALRTGTGSPETSITVGKSLNLFGYRTPLVFTHDKNGEVTTISGQMEWRFGNFVFSLGASQSTADSLAPSGEIRHSWSPR